MYFWLILTIFRGSFETEAPHGVNPTHPPPPRQIEHCQIKIAPAGGWWAPLDPLASWPLSSQTAPVPGRVGYKSHVHQAYDYLGPFGVLWVCMAWCKNCAWKNSHVKFQKHTWIPKTHVFPLWMLSCIFHKWKVTCEISHVRFTCKIHMWHVFHMWKFTCEKSHVKFFRFFHRANTAI